MNHLEFAAYESAMSQETTWEKWIHKVYAALGHDLDGDDLDYAFDAFERGDSVADFVQFIRDN